MRDDVRSTTAERVAIRRAVHQLLDAPPVLDDPVALRILGEGVATAMRADPAAFDPPAQRPLRASMVARSRYAEDELARAVQRGVGQYVILGAGLDTFAYRNPFPDGRLRVFEIDHPATQAWKRDRLAEAGIAIPPWTTFVPVDFEADALADRLRDAGWDAGRPTFFSWLGVVLYLDADVVMATLRWIASLPRGSGVVFDYAIPRETMTPRQRAVFDALASRVAAAGEPWRTFHDPAELHQALRAMGFTDLEDMDAPALDARYFTNRTDGLHVGSLARLVRATK